MDEIKYRTGSAVLPGQEGYPDNGNGEIILCLDDGEIITKYVAVDYKADPDDVAHVINKLLVNSKGGQLVYVDCGDNQCYFYLETELKVGRPIDLILKEMIETAEHKENSDAFVGKVFRNYHPLFKIHGYSPIPQVAPDVPDWDRKVSVTSLPHRFYQDLVVGFSQETTYGAISCEEVDRIIKTHLTDLTARELLGIWLNYEGIIDYSTTFEELFNALHKRS